MSVCRVFSCVVGRGCFLWPVHSLGKTLLAFGLLRFILPTPKLPVTPRVSWLLLLHSNPLWWKGHLLLVLVVEGLVGLHRTIQLQPLWHYWSGHRLGLLWYWMVCLGNKQVILSFLRLHPSTAFRTLVDYEGYSISSKGLLPTVVDIMVIWVKYTHSSPS